MRSLQVFVDHTLVGKLQEGDDLWSFEYDPTWASSESGFDLSPALSRHQQRHEDGGSLRPVQWYFDNLLPEELLRAAIAKEAGIKDQDDAFALLEYLGAESAGSLTLLPPGQAPGEAGELKALPDEELSRRIQKLPRTTLTQSAPKRMSLAGAQHKLLVVIKDGVLYEPVGAAPSTYILKPDHPDSTTYPSSTFNEWMTMRLAKAARLDVPAVELRYLPEPVYLVERFDRAVDTRSLETSGPLGAPAVRRLHIIDACQLLNKARGFKHTGASLDALNDIILRTTNPVVTRLNLFKWLVFNLVVANDDCHLKNLSFHVNPQGIWLAPHYDMLATCAYHTRAFADEHAQWPEVPLAIALPGAKRFSEVTLEKVLAAGTQLGVPEAVANRYVQQIMTGVKRAFDELYAAHETQDNLPADQIALRASQTRLLRVLKFITLKDMLERLTD